MRASTAAIAVLATLLGGCSEPCGSSNYWLDNGQRLHAVDGCQVPLTFARTYANAPFVTLNVGSGDEDLEASFELTRALTPGTQIVFLEEHLSVGVIINEQNIAGFGFHDPSASGAEPVEQPYMGGTLQVVDGPRGSENLTWKLSWNFWIGELGDPTPGGFQTHAGESWIDVLPSVVEWDFDGPWEEPPDWVPPG